MRTSSHGTVVWATMVVATVALALWGCSRESPVGPDPAVEAWGSAVAVDSHADGDLQRGDQVPTEMVTVDFEGEQIRFWPYTGTSLEETPMDPVNLLFVGDADPLRVRAALLSLDGNRPGVPSIPPFDQPWQDCVGGSAQTAYASPGSGWSGSVIQLSLGAYGPLRVHLRLFRTGARFGEGDVWTLGGAHFEVLIPDTADHQVLDWELAEQIVTGDLVRTGLLDPDSPLDSTGGINASPFREIPAMIYNGLPDDLIQLLGGPPKPVSGDVPLRSDGEGTILHLAGGVPPAIGVTRSELTVTYDRLVPRPFCVEGPYDWVQISGPVTFTKVVEIDEAGAYHTWDDYRGALNVVPFDMSTRSPVGKPFVARVGGRQHGLLGEHTSRIVAVDRRLSLPPGGPEMSVTRLQVADPGPTVYRKATHCLEE